MSVPSPMFGNPIGPWRRCFALLPTRTFDGCLVWLRPLVRRRIQLHQHLPGPGYQWWQYAYPKDIA
jgi:hypothetical protein